MRKSRRPSSQPSWREEARAEYHESDADETHSAHDLSSNSDYQSNSSGTASPLSTPTSSVELAVEPLPLEGRYYGDFDKDFGLGGCGIDSSRQGTEANAIDALAMLAMLGRA